MSDIVWFCIGIAVGAAMPDTIRALWRRLHGKAKEVLTDKPKEPPR